MSLRSDQMIEDFNAKHLKGQPVSEAIKLWGKPKNYEYITPWQFNMDTYQSKVVGIPYLKLTYYTGNVVLDSIFWFPCGGIRVFVNTNNRLTGIKQYCY